MYHNLFQNFLRTLQKGGFLLGYFLVVLMFLQSSIATSAHLNNGISYIYTPLIFNQSVSGNCQSLENENLFPNNTITQAQNTRSICNDQPFIGKHDLVTDNEDIYKMVVNVAGEVMINLDVPNINLSLRVYNNEVIEIGSSTNPGIEDESVTLSLNSGTYFVRIYRADENISQSPYTLSLTFFPPYSCETIDHEPNNFFLNANENLPLCEASTVIGQVSLDDIDDIYRIEVGTNGVTSVFLTNLPTGADYDLYLYDRTGAVFAISNNKGSQDEMIQLNLTNGRYYIRVFSRLYSDPNTYHLKWIRD